MYIDKDDSNSRKPILSKLIICFAGFMAGFIIFKLFFITFKIHDKSMEPAFLQLDTVFAMKYLTPAEGDVVIFSPPSQPETFSIKRIIATPGDTIEIKNKKIFINNIKFQPKWNFLQKDKAIFTENFTGRDNLSPLTLGENEYFLVGDNFDSSYDSREFGQISEQNISGVVLFSY